MSNPGQTITITVAAATAQANAELSRFFRGIQDRFRVVSQLNKEIQNGSAAANRIIGAAAAVFSAQAVRSFVTEAIDARKQQAQLEAALRSTGQASAAYSKELDEQRQALSQVTSADDDLLVSVQRQLISFGIQRSQMKATTELVLDLAAAMGTDAASAAMMFGRALSGEDVNFRGLRLEIDKTLPKTEQIAFAMDQLQKRFGGQARESFSAAAPEVERFGKSLGDARKELGALILDVGVREFLAGLSAGLQRVRDYVTQFQGRFPELSRDIQEAARAAGALFGAIAPYAAPVLALAVAVTALSSAVKLLSPALVLARVTMAALVGVDVVPYFLATATSVTGLATAIGTIAVAAAPAILALAALAAAGKIAFEAYSTGRAKLDEAQSAGLADAQVEGLGKAVQSQISKLVEAKLITEEYGKATQRELFDAHQAWLSGAIGIDDYRAKLKEVIAELPKLQQSAKTEAVSPLVNKFFRDAAERDRALKLSEAERDAATDSAVFALQEKRLQQSYERQQVDLQTFLARRRQLIEDARASQSNPLQLALSQVDTKLADNTAALSKSSDLEYTGELEAKRNALLIERNKLIAGIAQLDLQSKLSLLDVLDEERQLTAEVDRQRLARLEIAKAQTAGRVNLIEQDQTITQVEKKRQLLPLLSEELQLARQTAAVYAEQAANPILTDEVRTEAQRQYNAALLEQSNILVQQRDLLQQDTFTGTFNTAIVGLQNQWGSWAQQAATSFSSVFNSAIDSISNGITGLIMRTQSWSQALQQIGTSILTSIVQAIVQMGVRWIATQILMATMGKAIAAAATAALIPIAAAQSAILAGPATLATIGSYGGAAAQAPFSIAAAQAAVLAQSVIPREKGGPVVAGQPYLVGERGPELLVPDSAGRIIPASDTARMMRGGSAAGSAGSSGANVSVKTIVVADMREAALEALRSEAGEQVIVQTIDGRRIELGHNT